MVSDYTVTIDGVTLGVRESGTPGGLPVLHFHGTPGSRLEMTWADEEVAQAGVHLVTFDRPGYGQSTQLPTTLTSVARLALGLADHLDWQRFATMGWSGGGPFALATAALAPGRVSAVGVISGAGPFQQIPGELEGLEGDDAEGAALATSDRDASAAAFARTFAGLAHLSDEAELLAAFAPTLSARDQQALARPPYTTAILRDMQEAFRQGLLGGGWDNVAWIGPWDVDLNAVTCPVRLWYGDEDLMARAVVGVWLSEHLPSAHLTMRQGYGHLAALEHLPEMLEQLTAAGSQS
ncbi:alpha/beta hydrolase [Acidothermaceae bacterium B102]|nr:alpha/beta hydrolase [Acidothermaceae bacterium B102]